MAVQFRDYYETLGVAKTATEAEIKSAFRKLARKHHPDMAKARDKAAAEEKFKQINEAYEVLSDPEKRQQYDQLGANWNQPGGFQPPPDWGRGGGRGGVNPSARETVASSLSLAAPGSAISSRRSSAAGAGNRPSAAARASSHRAPERSAEAMSRPTSWSRWRRRCRARSGRFRCAAAQAARWNRTR